MALVNGEEWDLSRPLDSSCELVVVGFEHPVGKATFWHSAAHVLGQALELYFGGKGLTVHLRDGPALEEGGFFYDFLVKDKVGVSVTVSAGELDAIGDVMRAIVKAKQPFERRVVSKAEAAVVLAENPLKNAMMQGFPEDSVVTLYKSGALVDLCRGPHVPHTGHIRALTLTKTAGNVRKDTGAGAGETLQRVYGIAFPDKGLFKEWKTQQALATKIDHRILGPQQKLFMFHEASPGCAFFLPHGTRIYNTLMDYMRNHYRHKGFDEVITPLMFNKSLWETSGHWQNYKDDMYSVRSGCCDHGDPVEGEEEVEVGLKPMNCPSHCLIFASEPRSYRDLPMRLADFSPLHRNEASGSLSGLTRVRRFNQDDAHIFCRADQLADEIRACLSLVEEVYGVFGFEMSLRLSTRPEKYVGDLAVWDEAEAILRTSLEDLGKTYVVNEGDGAFYGPKIDIVLTDAFKRKIQCGTVQLDFQLPKRFGLQYKGADGKQHEPVMIHRAILGSLERMLAILTEHYHGRWPLWLSPRQVMVCPIAERHADYCDEIAKRIRDAGFFVDVNRDGGSVAKQVRNAQVQQYNYILVVGDQEMEQSTVAVRTRDGNQHGSQPVADVIATLTEAVAAHL
jgi:threonyl-tRNA synthetase